MLDENGNPKSLTDTIWRDFVRDNSNGADIVVRLPNNNVSIGDLDPDNSDNCNRTHRTIGRNQNS